MAYPSLEVFDICVARNSAAPALPAAIPPTAETAHHRSLQMGYAST
jgi:hypothetical protein